MGKLTLKTVTTAAAISCFAMAAQAAETANVTLETFQVAELVPNTTLDETQAVAGTKSSLERGDDFLRVAIDTQDLPKGAYTFWWHLTHADGEVTILWAGNTIVAERPGKAEFKAALFAGEKNAPGDIFIGHGLQPGTAPDVKVEFWVRNHGPLSGNPEIAKAQLTKPFGGCTDTRNPTPRTTDYPCWNPQRAVF
ncbi:MAG: hypothetical protein GKS02_12455 [Alphaproteobacteria bacterium]|nr:hypothetical protein [Alphaproteobacteria bacterium]